MTEQRSIPALDGLRAIAVLLVMLVHFTLGFPAVGGFEQGLIHLCGLGWCGVDIFFVLSGFLITRNLLAAKSSPRYWSAFYARRGLRILPPYFLLLVVVYAVAYGRPGVISASLTKILFSQAPWFWANAANILWLRGHALGALRHFWSLAVEEQFYLFWPLIIFLSRKETVARWSGGLWLGTVLLRLGLRAAGMHPVAIYVLTPARLDGFVAGAWLATLEKSGARPWWLTRPVLIAAGAWLLFTLLYVGTDPHTWPMQFLGYSAFAILSAAVIHRQLTDPTRWLAAPALRRIGRYSYCLYLVHFPVWFAWNHAQGMERCLRYLPWPLAHFAYLLVPIVLSCTLAALSDRFLEQPILRLKRFFPYESNQTAVSLPQQAA